MKKYLLLLLTLIFLPALVFASARSKVNAGNKDYKSGEYDKALDNYREAQMLAPNSSLIHYNMGDALYKSEKYDDASNELTAATASKNKKLGAAAYYNLGNNAFKSGKNDEAIELYKKALSLNPKDEDTKYNLEYLLTKRYQNQKKKDNKNDKDKKDGKDKQKQQQAKAQEGKKDDKKNKSGMSKEDAQRLLNVFDESDRNSAKKRKMNMPQIPKVEEDW